LLVFDARDAQLIASLPLEESADDLTLRPDGSEILVIHRNGRLWIIDPDTIEVVSKRSLPSLTDPESPYPARIAAGPGSVAFLSKISGYYGNYGNMYVLDTTTGDVLQEHPVIRDMVYHAGRSELFTWGARFHVDANGLLERVDDDDSGLIDGFTSLHISRDGRRHFVNNHSVNPDDLDDHRVIFPSAIRAITPNAELVSTSTQLLDPRNASVVATLPAESTLQAISPDYSRLFYFDQDSERLESLELDSLVDSETLGLRFEPAGGANVLPPDILRWIPRAGSSAYRVYLADSPDALAAPDPDPAHLLATTPVHWLAVDADTWQPGSSYFWRVDALAPDGTAIPGPVLSFRVSGLSVDRSQLKMSTAAGIDGRMETIAVSPTDPAIPWTATADQPWLALTRSGDTLEVRIDATSLAIGDYYPSITLQQGTDHITIPVTVWVRGIEIQQVITPPGSRFVYLRSEYRWDEQNAFMLRFDTETERFDRVAEIPRLFNKINTSLRYGAAYHPGDNCIYIVYGLPRASVARLDPDTFRLDGPPVPVEGLPETSGWSSSSPVVAGPAGRLILGREQSWLVDTATMSVVGPPINEMAGVNIHASTFDPAGPFLYLDVYPGDQQRWLVKYRMDGDDLTELAATAVDNLYYDHGEPLLLSADGRRLFRGREVYDSELNQLARIRPDYYYSFEFRPVACTSRGEFVTNGTALYNGHNGLEVGQPVQSSYYLAIAPDQRRLFQFGWREPTWTVTDLHALSVIPGGDVSLDIPDSGILFNSTLPLGWQHEASAFSYRVFLGTDETAVRDADADDPEFVGETILNSITPPIPLAGDRQYFIRVDVVGYTAVRMGQPQSFRTAPFDAAPNEFAVTGPAGIPLPEQSISLDAPGPVDWTASTSTTWIALTDTSGTTPSNLRFTIDTSSLGDGEFEGSITLSANGRTWDYPVFLALEKANIIIARLDADAGLVYAISQFGDDQRYENRFYPAFLVVYDATTGQPLRFVPAGTSVSDLLVHQAEDRIYLAHWKSGEVRVLDRSSLEQVDLFSYEPFVPDRRESRRVYTLAAGPPGRLLMGRSGVPAELQLVDSADGRILDSWWPEPFALRAGSQASLQDGRFCIHSENAGNRGIYKLDLEGDRISVAARGYHPNDSAVIPSADEQRIFNGKTVFDGDLNEIGTLPVIPLAIEPGENFIIATGGVYNRHNGERVHTHNMSVQKLVLAEDTGQVLVFSPNQPLPSVYSLDEVLGFGPGDAISPLIPDGAVLIGRNHNLAWESDPRAVSYNVFLGTDAAAVAAAGPGSPGFLGSTTTPGIAVNLALDTGYFWRVDAIGHGGVLTGEVLSFRTTPVSVDPNALTLNGLAGIPFPDQPFELAAELPTTWSATTETPWLSLLDPAGTTPGGFAAVIDHSEFEAANDYPGSIRIEAAGKPFDLPVNIGVGYFEVLDAEADRERPLIYATTGTTHASYRTRPSFMVVIDAVTEKPLRAVEVGTGAAIHVMIHYPENRIYVTDQTNDRIVVFDRDSFERVATMDSNGGYWGGRTQPGAAGRMVLTNTDNKARVELLDTTTGELLATSFFDGHPHYWDLQGGSGIFDPSNRWLYYGEKGGDFIRFDTAGDRLAPDASFQRNEGNPGLTVVRNDSGSRYFWGGHMLDEHLNLLWDFGHQAPGNWGNYVQQIDPAGKRIFAWDSLNVIRVFDAENRRYLFRLHQVWGGDVMVYSPPTGKLFDFVNDKISATAFQPVIEPLASPPGVVWASGGLSPWTEDPAQPGTMVSTPTILNYRGSRCVAHIPTAATVAFQGRGTFSAGFTAYLDDDAGSSVNGNPEWQDYRFEVPQGGGFFTWYSDTTSEANPGQIRNIAIMRSRPIPPGPVSGGATTPPDSGSDQDNDGSDDLVEWAAGGDSTDSAIKPVVTHFIENGEFVFRFKRRLALGGVTLVAETSRDMSRWQPLAFPDVRQVDIDATFETLEVRLPLDGPSRFIRLRAESPQ
jgi:hypothetical protein